MSSELASSVSIQLTNDRLSKTLFSHLGPLCLTYAVPCHALSLSLLAAALLFALIVLGVAAWLNSILVPSDLSTFNLDLLFLMGMGGVQL